jgi:hypothetical protein
MLQKGDKPGKGIYVCLDCGSEQNLHTEKEPLKECRCGGIDSRKKEAEATAKY